jgi:hypothetical protein
MLIGRLLKRWSFHLHSGLLFNLELKAQKKGLSSILMGDNGTFNFGGRAISGDLKIMS